MYCKYCGKEIPKGSKKCPDCSEKKNNQNKSGLGLKLLLAFVILALVTTVLVLIITLGSQSPDNGSTTGTTATTPTDGDPDKVFCKGSYSAGDDVVIAAKDTVVATMGEDKLTVGQLQVYYWMQVYDFLDYYGSYAPYMGLDYTKPLDTQIYDKETGMSWQQFFLDEAVKSWQRYNALYQAAKTANFELPDDYKEYFEGLEESLLKTAKENKFETVDELIQADMGKAATFADYEYYLIRYYYGYLYFSEKAEDFEATMDEIEAYFEKNAADLKTQHGVTKDSGKLYDVRHILVQPDGGLKDNSGNMTWNESEWAAGLTKAERVYNEWKNGNKVDEESFAAMAVKYSADGNAAEGGLYSYIAKGKMVAEFENWALDASRKYGDHAIVKTQYGYHIMYFVSCEEGWIRYSREGVMSEKANKYVDDLIAANSIDPAWENVVLAVVELG